ncbi:helix-turn-helix domain-containing protein [Sphingomonas sp. RB3P16]|uniref:TetR/AcrR family transcriptional regulator n=1 Tax=Parasphingomonas frigoris TaxID=3096163 RepID=UPI002FC616E6
MLAATEQLMLERGSEDFTLQEVSTVGSVSVGSIYLRFESKDNLVRAVIASELERVMCDEDAMLAEVLAAASSIDTFMPRFVESYSEVLRHHSPLLRIIMQRAAQDPLVSESGRRSAHRSENAAVAAILSFKDEIGGDNAQQRATATFHIIFATLARQLSLGSTDESAGDLDWAELKIQLAEMCAAYLKKAG